MFTIFKKIDLPQIMVFKVYYERKSELNVCIGFLGNLIGK